MGRIAAIVTDIRAGQNDRNSWVNWKRPSGSVQWDWSWRMRSGQKKPFQAPWNCQDGDGREGRAGEGQHDPQERREEAGAVDLGGLLEVARDRQEVLPHEEELSGLDGQDEDHADVVGGSRVISPSCR